MSSSDEEQVEPPLHKLLWEEKEKVTVEDVRALVDKYPDAVMEKDYSGFLPLHIAVYGASLEVIQLLIKEYPGAVKEKDNFGSLPLHMAIHKGASVEVIQLLIEEYPYAVKEKNVYGWLPLHFAVEKGASDGVFQLLVKEYPGAVKEKDRDGRLPLHKAIEKGASAEVIQLLIKEYPDAAKEEDNFGFLPLHIAVRYGASLEVIQLLVKEYPDAMRGKDKFELLPLHMAIEEGASAEVIQLLISKYPDAVREKGEEGLPLHYAVKGGASVEVMQLLISKYPDTTKEKSDDGRLPLHLAVMARPLHWAVYFGAPIEVIQLLVNEHPAALKEKGYNGDLPLHRAIEKRASVEVIKLLIDEYPDAVKEKNNSGELPLHYAAKFGASVEVIQLLIKEYPDTAKEKNIIGDLPLQKAVEESTSVDSIQLILNAYPQAAKEKMKDGRLPIEVYLENEDAGDLVLALLKVDMPVSIKDGMPVEHSGSWFTCVSSNTKNATAAVRQVLSNNEGGAGFGRHIHVLADVRDAEGRTALAAASSGARTDIYNYLLFCGRYKLHIGPPEHRSGSSTLFRAQDLGKKANYGVIFDKADINEDGNLDKKELNAIAESIGLDPDLFLRGSDKNTISKAEFIATCKRQLGDGPREVVIKFMQKDHWERENKARADYELNPKFVVSALSNTPLQTEIAEAVERGDGGLDAIEKKFLSGIKPGKYAIIMNAAERNLQQILFQEQPQIDAVRDMLRQVFEAVQHLHNQGLMHGDLKMVNIVRFRIDNKLRLIDLDASAGISAVEEAYAGAKFSSAILPPEMIKRIVAEEELEALKKYWETETDAENDEGLYEKVKPKPYKERGVLKAHYVVKSFRTKDGQPVHNGLPYELVNASSSIDAWSLGVLAFTLLTGETLVPSTFVDDCASGAAMHVLYSWGTQPEVLSELFKKIHDDAARDLVRQLLRYEPAERPSIASLLKDHPFFNTQIGVVWEKLEDMDTKLELAAKNRQDDRALLEKMDANILVIKQLSFESKAEIRRTRYVLMKGIYEATEIDAPTTFTVVNEELPPAKSVEKAKKQILDIIAKEDGSGISVKTEIASLDLSAEGAVIALEGDLKEHYEKFKTGMKWIERIKKIGSKVAAGEVDEAFDVIKHGIKDLIVGKEMYLYLVDELTGEPVRAKGWPLIITRPTELVHKLVPLMQLGLRGLSIINGVAGVAILFGFPVPKVPKTLTKGAQESVELLKKESSVEEFGVVHEEVKGGGEEQKSVRGASLREFKDFLKKNDPGLKEGKSGDFAGLQRIGDPEDGAALWTALTDPKDIEDALKKRAQQRKEEQLKHKEYIKQTAKKEIELEGEEGTEEVEISEENTGSTAGASISSNERNSCCAMM